MTQNSKRVSWVYIVLLFHAAIPDRTLSSTTVTGSRATGKAALESMAVPARRFQHWAINGGHVIPGEYATVPGAFKYSAMVEVDNVRCSASVIATKWLLSSTHCFSSRSGTKDAIKSSTRRIGPFIVQQDVSANTNPVGFAYAGGTRYQVNSDMSAEGVQQQRLEALVLYTESRAQSELRMHDIMLVQVGPSGFRFNHYVQPILFTNQRRFSLGRPRTCIVVGFGDNNFETITLASLLKSCSGNDGAENAVCVDEFRWPCLGDAGAPLVCQNMLVGTLRSEGLLPNDRCVKHAQDNAKNFTFVGYYRDWIEEHTSVQFGMWHSGSPGRYTSPMSRGRGASYAVMLLLDTWMYMCLK